MGKLIDLHVHSDCSDGTCSPEELVELAKQKGLSAFALTDHDTTEGVARARHAAEGTEVCVIPGIEFSTSYEKRDVHVLGLGIDPEDEYFQENLDRFRNSRDRRNEEMIRKMQEHGISITQEEVEKLFPDAVITRAHFARFLVEKKFVGSTNEAFDRYLGDRACCFVPREKVTPFQAVRLIKENGGYAVLAHPLIYGFSKGKLEELVREMKKAGADGIEAIYSQNRWNDEGEMRALAKRHGLKITGGSDFHGSNKPGIEMGTGKGNLRIPYELWENLRR
ncbi:MAG TPA: PHP domain-containing protein [Candidatus Blautia intestinigallinarum]|nr:PHP domain-containing protein [Candidatus Blautia intestinigallinarum]